MQFYPHQKLKIAVLPSPGHTSALTRNLNCSSPTFGGSSALTKNSSRRPASALICAPILTRLALNASRDVMVSSTRATRRTVVTAADDLLALGGASRVSRAQGGTGASRVQTARRAAKRGRTVSSPSAACEEGARHDQAGKNTRGDGGNNDRNAINSPSDSTLGQTHAATAIVPSDDVLSLSAHGTAMAQPMTPPKNTKTGRPKKDKVPTPERKKHKKELDARRREESQVQLLSLIHISAPTRPY